MHDPGGPRGDGAELRRLQQRAFGRGDEPLTAADAARLRELTNAGALQTDAPRDGRTKAARTSPSGPDRAVGSSPTSPRPADTPRAAAPRQAASAPTTDDAPAPPDDPATPSHISAAAERDSASRAADPAGPARDPEPKNDGSATTAARRRWPLLVAGAVACALVGAVAGYLGHTAAASNDAQTAGAVPDVGRAAAERAFQRDGGFDEGTLSHLARLQEVDFWTALRDGGKLRCVASVHVAASDDGTSVRCASGDRGDLDLFSIASVSGSDGSRSETHVRAVWAGDDVSLSVLPSLPVSAPNVTVLRGTFDPSSVPGIEALQAAVTARLGTGWVPFDAFPGSVVWHGDVGEDGTRCVAVTNQSTDPAAFALSGQFCITDGTEIVVLPRGGGAVPLLDPSTGARVTDTATTGGRDITVSWPRDGSPVLVFGD